MIGLALAAILGATQPSVRPELGSTEAFLRGCHTAASDEDPHNVDRLVEAATCIAFVKGVSATVGMLSPVKIGDVEICAQDGVAPMRIIRRIVAIDTDDPANLKGYTDRLIVIVAMAQIAPCGKPKK